MAYTSSDAEPSAAGYTETTGIPLYWASYGSGDERALVLHGGPGAHHDYLLPQMLALAEKRELIFYDQRGGGKSPDDSREPVSWRMHAGDVAAVVSELALQPLTLVGYSWGGLLALLYALEALEGGERARAELTPRRLVLIDPAPVSRRHRDVMQAEFQRRQRSDRTAELRGELAASALRESDPDEYRRRLFHLSVRGYFSDPDRASELTPFRVTARVQDQVWESLGDYDFLHRITELDVPALVIHGRDDPIPVESSSEIAEALNARLLVLERTGHVPYIEQPHALFSAIESFLDAYPL